MKTDFLTGNDHGVVAHTVTQFHGSVTWEKSLIVASRGSTMLFFVSPCLSVGWENVMSYQLLLVFRGQTAKCHQIANQLIQISLHWAKSLLIPQKIQSVFSHRSTCSSVCVCSHVGIRDSEKGNSSCWWTMIVLQWATFTLFMSFSLFSCLVCNYFNLLSFLVFSLITWHFFCLCWLEDYDFAFYW